MVLEVCKRESFWKKVIIGWSGRGVMSKGVRGGYEVGVGKAIRNEWEIIRNHSPFKLGNGRWVKLLKTLWSMDQTLKEAFHNLYHLVVNKDC